MDEKPTGKSEAAFKVAVIGASGKTGHELVREGLKRGYQMVAVCRQPSVEKLASFDGHAGFNLMTASEVSDPATLTRALAGCNAVVAVLISVRNLKATELVSSLAAATAATGVRRLVFTAGEITAVPEAGETLTLRQRLMATIIPPLMKISPYSVADMIAASVRIAEQADWEWTIVRAPSLTETAATGYRFGEISEITSKHALSRDDYAACLLDSLSNRDHHRRTLMVTSAKV